MNYWAVGADHDGTPKLEEFLDKGIWYDGYADDGDDRNRETLSKVVVGDILLVKSSATKGQNHSTAFTKLKAIGVVISKDEYYSFNVNWFKVDGLPKDFDGIAYRKTIEKVRDDEMQYFAKKAILTQRIGSIFKPETSMNYSLNQILYGPPGTGKTYNTKAYAVAIANGLDVAGLLSSEKEIREEVVGNFRHLEKQGRVKFCTFHQSMSYEDFVEGIKPETIDKGLLYNTKLGILGEFSKRAENFTSDEVLSKWNDVYRKYLQNENFWKIDPLDDHYMIDNFLKDGFIALNTFPSLDLSEVNSTEDFEKEFKEQISTSQDVRRGLPLYLRYFKLSLKNDQIIFLSKGNKEIVAIGKVIGDYYFVTGDNYPHRRDVEWMVKDFIKPVSEFYSVGFNQNFYAIYKHKLKVRNLIKLKEINEDLEPHILIIDEINRGNIAAIFGELITLLEESKRQGQPDETWVTLTYSGEQLCLPPNLYIIGTMNTADRSVEALDTALRRRFSFIEMPPRPDLLDSNIDGINLQSLLSALNARITALKDSDHTIGHAWFIDCKSKSDILNILLDKVIPLLREHFYHENEKLEAVIGSQFFDAAEAKVKFLAEVNGNLEGTLTKRLLSKEEVLAKDIDLVKLYI